MVHALLATRRLELICTSSKEIVRKCSERLIYDDALNHPASCITYFHHSSLVSEAGKRSKWALIPQKWEEGCLSKKVFKMVVELVLEDQKKLLSASVLGSPHLYRRSTKPWQYHINSHYHGLIIVPERKSREILLKSISWTRARK